MMTLTTAPNNLETESIGKLLWKYATPAIIGTMVMSFYNIVDRIFIGQGVGPNAISGLALTFPIMSLSAAFGMLVGAGGAARISIALGRHDHPWAEKILGNSLIMILVLASCYITGNLIFLKPILREFGGSENTIPYAVEYLHIIIPSMMLSNLMYSFNNMMRASGYPRKAMYTMLIGAVANLILDPLFIFLFDMGIRGAAIATAISLFISTVFVMFHFLQPGSYVRFRRHSLHIEWKIVRNVISIGLSPFLINITASGVNIIMNTSLQQYGGDTAIGAYGIINSVATLFVMLIIGLCQGMQPIVGYNYGANRLERMRKAFRLTVEVATVFTTVGFLSVLLFPETIARAFTTDSELLAVSAHGLRTVLFAFPIVGFQIVTTNFFQSIGMASKSIFLSLSRQVLFLIPLLLFFPRLWGLNGIWMASPASDVIATLVTLVLLFHQRHIFKARSQENIA